MPGLVPGIHVFLHRATKTWMAGTSPAMTKRRRGTIKRGGCYAASNAGTGNAVTDLIFSIANREVTFFSATALISFL
jgi:hypothetical protein